MNAVGIILAGGSNQKLSTLVKHRAAAALPIGSCYRAIDFPLSNMTNSGINKVAVMTQYNSRSLYDHLSSSKWWDLGRKQGGLYMFSPFMSTEFTFRGTADAIFQNLTFLRRSKEEYVVISSGDCVYKMDYNEMLAHHKAKEADITIAYRHVPENEDISQYGVIALDEDGRLEDIEEKPLEPESRMASTGVYIIKRQLLIELVEAIALEGRYDFVRDIISRYRKRLKIHGFYFNDFWRSLISVDTYFSCNMEFLQRGIREKFILSAPHIHTKPKDEPPAKFNNNAHITNSVVGSGAILDGNAHRSIIFRNARIGEDSIVRNSIIMEGVEIGRGCKIEYAILDKEVVVHDGAEVAGRKDLPLVVAKGSVVGV